MKSITVFKIFATGGILLFLSGIIQCQRGTQIRPSGTRLLGSGVRSRLPSLRLRNRGRIPTSQIANQTTSRRGSPRLLGFIIPSSTGGRPQLRLMPGAQDFIRPGRRIAAAPLSQLQRLGGSQTQVGRRRGGLTGSQTMTGIPTSLLGRTQTRRGSRGRIRGSQIRRLPQSALNTINAARQRTPTRQPNIVFVRPPTRNRAVGLTPDQIRRIRLLALRRAAAQRAASTGRTGVRQNQTLSQPTGQLRGLMPPARISRLGTRSREEINPTIRRVSDLNVGRNQGSLSPRRTRPAIPRPPQTDISRTGIRRPTRVDEAVLRANIVPAGLTPGIEPVRRVITSSSSSSESSTTKSSSSSSETSVVSSGLTGGAVVDVVQAVQPVATVIAPSPELQFRTTVDDTASAAVVAPGAGIVAAVPTLASGPPFQVLTSEADPNINIDPGAAISESVSVDIGAASAGPALVVNPTVVDNTESVAALVNPGQVSAGIAAIAPTEGAAIVSGGAVLPIEDPKLVAAIPGPSLPTGKLDAVVSGVMPDSALLANIPALSGGNENQPLTVMPSIPALLGGNDNQPLIALPNAGSMQLPEMGAVVPGPTLGTLGIGDVPTTLAKSNPEMNSLKSVIADVLRDMALQGASSNIQPDISAMARAVLEAERKKDGVISVSDTNLHKPGIQQTFTLGPSNPSLIEQALPVDILSPNSSSGAASSFGTSTLNGHSLLTTKPAITSKTGFLHDHGHAHGDIHTMGSSHDLLHHVHHDNTGFLDTTSHKKTNNLKLPPTTAAPSSTNDQVNMIVGDWAGAEKSLSPPPPPPEQVLGMDHTHGHGHFHDHHVHGFSDPPSIPRPPPVAPDVLTSSGLSAVSDQTKKAEKHSSKKKSPANNELNMVVDSLSSSKNNAGFVETLGANNNLASANVGKSNQDAGLSHGADFSVNNRQTGMEGVSIPVATPAAGSDVTIDNINTIAIENKLFDANRPIATGRVGVPSDTNTDTNPLLPVNIVNAGPSLDNSQPIGEQLMKQLPVPQELVNALSFGNADANPQLGNPISGNMEPTNSNSLLLQNNFQEASAQTQNVLNNKETTHSDQRFSLNNVRDGLILDSLSTSSQTDPVATVDGTFFESKQTDTLSAPSLDKLAMNLPSDILTTPKSIADDPLKSTLLSSSLSDQALLTTNNDPTIRKIANILPNTGPTRAPDLPLMALDAKGFSAEGRFSSVQRGFSKTTRLSSKNGINLEMQLSPLLSSKHESSHSKNTKQESQTATIQTDGSFLGSSLPVPPPGAGKGIPPSPFNERPFYDQAALLGSLSATFPEPVQQIPVNIPMPPPPVDNLPVQDVAMSTNAADTSLRPSGIKSGSVRIPDIPPPPAVSFTSTFDVPVTNALDPSVVSQPDPAGALLQPELAPIDNNPNWAVFDPTTVPADINFADINPIINGVVEPGPEISFVNTNDIKFTNAFDVSPVVYNPAPDLQISGTITDMGTKQRTITQVGMTPSDTVNTGLVETASPVNSGTNILSNAVLNNGPSGKNMQFEEVVIAPLPFSSNSLGQGSINIPPPPPI